MDLTKELREWQEIIEKSAKSYGLDFFETIFELLPFKELNATASFMGFPGRYPHWRFGMEYESLSKAYAYGLQKIYEMVINNNPTYAYLLDCNNLVDQKMVMAHVFGHADFFKNNIWFSKTDRKMLDKMADHRAEIRAFIDKYGYEVVETFIDTCLSLENLIDRHAPFIERRVIRTSSLVNPEVEEEKKTVKKIPTDRSYLEPYMNPADFLKAEQKKIDEEERREQHFPENPEKDIMLFLIENAPFLKTEEWKRRVLEIVREEAYYFVPQAQTKIMNEGWASYWHTKIMTGSDRTDPYQRGQAKPAILADSEIIDFAEHHSGTVATSPGRLNPYKLGLELFRDIEERWNQGKFGKEYDECDDFEIREQWDKKLGMGREKIFEVRKIHNDVTFIDSFLTYEFCQKQKLFVYRYNKEVGVYIISDRDFQAVKQQLLFSLTNSGQPHIYVQDGNYDNRGELFLEHHFEGHGLDRRYIEDSLRALYRVWGRPVWIKTKEKSEDEGREQIVIYGLEEDVENGINIETPD
ncbi:MAG: SpoVR family protein [bacterium]|nr:SpoVR family protein [bacterium]